MAKPTPIDRFLAKLEWSDRTHEGTRCLVWAGTLDTNGYGTFYNGERSVRAHRYAYERWVGPIPEGHQVHHECRNRACVSPSHLTALSTKEHGQAHRVDFCKRGHAYTPENTILKGDGRCCRTCQNANNKAWRLRGRLLSDPQAKAIELIGEAGDVSPIEFARLMWPDKPGWKKTVTLARSGRQQGVGMYRTAGAFLAKLARRGWIERLDVEACRYVVTDDGRSILAADKKLVAAAKEKADV